VAVPPAPDASSGVTEDDSRPDRASRSPLLRRGLLVVLVVVLVGSAAAAGFLATNRSVPALGIQGDQDSLQTQRDQVGAQAEQFMLRVNTYDPTLLSSDGTMPKYRELVEDVITPKFAADFEQAVPLTEQVVQQSKITLTCEVFSTAVSAIDEDSATALVAGATTATIPSTNGGDPQVISQPSQMKLSLVKSKGRWLVDDFSPLVGGDQPSGGASPSGSPTSGATGGATASPTDGTTP
jgi:Mce-associated membrane protein